MESILEVYNNNIKLWNSKVQKLKDQQEITKNYLTNNINNLQITNNHLQQMEIFMADAHAHPKFINQITSQFEKEQERNKLLPFMVLTLKELSTKHNISFVYMLFEMVNDPDTNSVIIWSKSGTSFFIKDAEGLQDHVQERFSYTIRTFYKKLSEFGFRCVDKFLCEYTNDNFQRDNKHMLKNIRNMRKLQAVKRNIQSDMEEELKRQKFFQNELKVNISNIKEKEQTTKCDMLNVKRCLENASKRISYSPSVDFQHQAYGMENLKQDGAIADIEKIKQELCKLNVQILNLEQGHKLIEDQLAAIERIFPSTKKKQKEIEFSMHKLFMNQKVIPRKRSRTNKKNKEMEKETKKAWTHSSESPIQAMNENGHNANREELTINFETQESNNSTNWLMENDNFSDTDIAHDDLKRWIGILQSELTSQEKIPSC